VKRFIVRSSGNFLYFSSQLNEMQNRMAEFFGPLADRRNVSLVFSDPTSQKPFMTIATDVCPDMHLVGAASESITIPRSIDGTESADNITDWALEQFRAHYNGEAASPHPEEPAPAGVSKDGGTKPNALAPSRRGQAYDHQRRDLSLCLWRPA
jgi:hypothetical protein